MTLDRRPDDRKPLLVPARAGGPRLASCGGAGGLGAWRRQRRSPSNAPAARPSSRSTPSCAPSSPTSRRRRRARSPTSAPRSTSCARAPPRSRSASSRAWRRRARRARSSTGSSRRGSRRPRTRPTRRSAPSTTSRMADDLLRGLLRQGSRSFYLSLAILPRPALDPSEELDRYASLVAGCVGPFWTALPVAHRPRLRHWKLGEMSEQGVRFGKALQLTNVLRDVPADLRHGRCYLPADGLATLGLGPKDLLDRDAAARALPLYRRLLGQALEHYDVAWRYTLAIPRL